MDSLTPKQRQDLQEVFRLYDRDGNGTISKDELGVVFRSLGRDLSKEEYAKMVARADLNQSGAIEFEEFAEAAVRRFETAPFEAEMRQAFSLFDKDRSGSISAEELKHVMESLGERLTDDEVKEMISAVDKDGDGTVDYEEFVALLKS